MIRLIKILFVGFSIMSCNQNVDLERLKYGENIYEIANENKNIVKDQDVTYKLLSYRTKDLKDFVFGHVSFSKYEFPNGYNADYNDLYIHVDNYKNNKFLGFTLEIVNQQESKNLLEYLKTKYGTPESRYTGNEDKAFVWYNNKSSQWILINQYDRITKDNKSFLYTKCTIIKQGVRVENSKNKTVFTILDNFSLKYPINK